MTNTKFCIVAASGAHEGRGLGRDIQGAPEEPGTLEPTSWTVGS